MSFREDFAWGVASSSYQVEGASKEDGKGANIWDIYTQEKSNKVYQNQTGEMGLTSIIVSLMNYWKQELSHLLRYFTGIIPMRFTKRVGGLMMKVLTGLQNMQH